MNGKLLIAIGLGLALGVGSGAAWAAPAAAPDVTTLAPAASPFVWSAEKAADGTITLEGDVPTADTRDTLVDGIDKLGADNTKVASGAPDGFADKAVAALDLLGDLDSGTVRFDGTTWSVTGAVDSADKAKAAQAAFDASALKSASATYTVTAPSVAAAPATAAAPAASAAGSGYAWSATKGSDGTVTFDGQVPNAGLKAMLAAHAGGKAVDNSTVAEGAPLGFGGGAIYGVDALARLESGKLAFADGKWSLSGAASDAAHAKAATGPLAAIDHKAWNIDISAAPATAAAAASPAPAAAPASAPATPAPATASTYTFTAVKSAQGNVALSGDVPTEGAKTYFAGLFAAASTDNVKIEADAPKDFVINALGGLEALNQLEAGQLVYDGGKWALTGKAATVALRDELVASLGKLPAGAGFGSGIAGPSPLEQCTSALAALGPARAINFAGGRTAFAKGADADLDKIAAVLALCPDTRVNIKGNTDSDGAAAANMALSVARAEAVATALEQRGIAESRLYAIGYGETLPLVPNTTAANKARNRRIDIEIVPH